MIIKFHHPFKLNEFHDWFLINIGVRWSGGYYGGFIIIFNFGIEIYAKS